MGKKFLCIALAAAFAASSLAISANAVTVENEPSTDYGTFFFDSGDWKSTSICFFLWDSTTGEYAKKDGWSDDNKWGSKKWIGGTPVEGKDGVFESYEIDFTGRESHDLYVIFHDPNTNEQTFDAVINSSALGHTAKRDGKIYENPVDSEKKAEGIVFDGGEGLGVAKVITSTGKIQGDVISPNTNRADKVASYVLNYLGVLNDSGEEIVTAQSVANAMASFGTNADEVWAAYLTYEGSEGFNKEAAEPIIKSGVAPSLGTIKLGDVNKSGDIDSVDALLILRRSVNLETFDEDSEKAADIDGDNFITSADSLQALRYSVKIETPYAIGELV